MCGICGVKSSAINTEKIITKLLSKLYHRGPDNSGFKKFKNFYLGSTRLKIIDLSNNANMPMTFEQYSISYNGEIYNFKELRNDLIQLGYKFETNSDTEVILKLFSKFGVESFKKLEGMFSICIYDNKFEQIYLARDIFGIKPLYYYLDKQSFYFSSELTALTDCFPELKKISKSALKTYLLKGSILEPKTKYKNFLTVLPGQVIKVNNNFEIKKFFFQTIKDIILKSENSNEIISEDDLFNEVKFQIKLNNYSDAKKSIMLSSGIDSLAIKFLSNNIKSFTMGYEDYKNTDNDEIYRLKKYLNIDPDVSIYITEDENKKIIDKFEKYTDSLSIDGPQYVAISSRIKLHNYKMSITGVGADEMFNSYPSAKFLPIFSRFQSILPKINKEIDLENFPKIQKIIKLFFNCKNICESYLVFREIFNQAEIKKIFNGKNYDTQETFDISKSINEYVKDIKSKKNQIKSLETNIYLRDQVLKDVDYATMQNSVEARVPYLSKSLLSMTSNLSISEKLSKNFLLNKFDLEKNYKKNYKKKGFMTLNSLEKSNKNLIMKNLNHI